MAEMTPIDWLIQNKDAVRDAYTAAGGSPKKAWKEITAARPDLVEQSIMGENSFKQYSRIVISVIDALPAEQPPDDSVRQELDITQTRLNLAEQELLKYKDLLQAAHDEKSELRSILDSVRQELDITKEQLETAQKENLELRSGLDTSGQTDSDQDQQQQTFTLNDEPVSGVWRVRGWNLRKSNDGFIRAYRKIEGKLHSVYIGKNVAAAERKIMAKEKQLGLV